MLHEQWYKLGTTTQRDAALHVVYVPIIEQSSQENTTKWNQQSLLFYCEGEGVERARQSAYKVPVSVLHSCLHEIVNLVISLELFF